MKKKYYIYEMNLVVLNIISIIIMALMFILTYLIFKFLPIDSIFKIDLYKLLVFYFFYMILHELLHSLSYYLYGAKFKNIVYGLYIEKGVAYCLCKQNISRKNILNSLMFPLFYIGFVTYIISFIVSSPYLLILSILNISGCAGDIIMFNFIRKLPKDVEYSEFDDAVSFGIYSTKKLDTKCFGLKFKGTKDTLVRNDLKKLSISKLSYVFLILIFICLLFAIF